jgi:protein ImuB
MKRFISVWFPDWPIARLLRDTPELADKAAGRPFALVSMSDAGLVISAANHDARTLGIEADQELQEARLLVPNLLTHEVEPEKDRAALLALATWAGRYSARTNIDGTDGFWIEWSSPGKDRGEEALVLEDLHRRLESFGLEARIAIADTFGAAFALSRSAATLQKQPVHSMSGGAEMALSRLPVASLRLSHKAVTMLNRLGFKRIGQLYDIARGVLESQIPSREVADALLLRLDQALGYAEEPMKALGDPILPTVKTQREVAADSPQRRHFFPAPGVVFAIPSAPMNTAKMRMGPEPVFLPL